MSYKYVNKKINEKEKRKLYKCLKLSIATAGIYIVALATGFALVSKDKTNSKQETVIETIYEDDNTLSEFERFNYMGYNNYYKILSLSKEDSKLYNGKGALQSFDIKCTPREFAEIIGASDVTYQDCIDALSHNLNIDKETKELLINAINNISSQLQSNNIPLATLKHNLFNLTIKYVSESEIYDYKFNPYECCLYINENYIESDLLKKYIIIKGAIGYGMTNAYTKVDGKKILCSTSEYYYIMDNNPEVVKLGKTFEDGFAEIITSLSRGDVIDCSDSMIEHSEDAYLFQIISNLCDMQLSDYISNGYVEIVNRLASTPEFEQMLYNFKKLDVSYYDRLSTVSNMLYSYISALYNKVQQMDSMNVAERKYALVSSVIEICIYNRSEYMIVSGPDSKGVAPDSLMYLLDNYIDELCQEEVKAK